MKKFKNTILISLITIASLITVSCSSGGIVIPDEYNYDDLTKYITVCDYKTIDFSDDIAVSDEDVQEEIDEALANSQETVKKKSGTVTEDCIANIDYVGSLNGKEFDGGAGEGYDLDIANSTFIEGFAEALVGHSVGENFDINVTFPEDYGSDDLAGKDAVFNITVNYISEKTTPELTDEWTKTNTIYSTVEEYKDSLKTSLRNQKLLEAIVDKSEVVSYPETELKANEEKCMSYYGASEVTDEIKQVAEDSTKQELVLHQIARLENLELTDEGYNEYINKLLSDAGMDAESFEEKMGVSIGQYASENKIFNSYLYQNVMEKLEVVL